MTSQHREEDKEAEWLAQEKPNRYKEAFYEINTWLRENHPEIHKQMLRGSIQKNNEEVRR